MRLWHLHRTNQVLRRIKHTALRWPTRDISWARAADLAASLAASWVARWAACLMASCSAPRLCRLRSGRGRGLRERAGEPDSSKGNSTIFRFAITVLPHSARHLLSSTILTEPSVIDRAPNTSHPCPGWRLTSSRRSSLNAATHTQL